MGQARGASIYLAGDADSADRPVLVIAQPAELGPPTGQKVDYDFEEDGQVGFVLAGEILADMLAESIGIAADRPIPPSVTQALAKAAAEQEPAGLPAATAPAGVAPSGAAGADPLDPYSRPLSWRRLLPSAYAQEKPWDVGGSGESGRGAPLTAMPPPAVAASPPPPPAVPDAGGRPALPTLGADPLDSYTTPPSWLKKKSGPSAAGAGPDNGPAPAASPGTSAIAGQAVPGLTGLPPPTLGITAPPVPAGDVDRGPQTDIMPPAGGIDTDRPMKASAAARAVQSLPEETEDMSETSGRGAVIDTRPPPLVLLAGVPAVIIAIVILFFALHHRSKPPAEVDVHLTLKPSVGGTHARLDGKDLPSSTSIVIDKLSVGHHAVSFEKSGFETSNVDLDVSGDGKVAVGAANASLKTAKDGSKVCFIKLTKHP
jgi:hypothetical protein